MNELIKIEKSNVGGDLIDTVNARELHSFLEVGKDFSNWIKNRIKQYGFVEDVDYLVAKTGEQVPHQGGVRTVTVIDYHLSIDMAKELAMVERSVKGREVRQYFIECEKRLKQVVNKPVPLLSPKEEDFRVLEFIANSLRLPDSGKLGMYEKYCKHQAPQLLPALPSYAVDSPTGSTAGSSELTFPVLESVNMKKQAFTKKMSKSSDGCLFQDVETMSDKITRQVLLRLLKI